MKRTTKETNVSVPQGREHEWEKEEKDGSREGEGGGEWKKRLRDVPKPLPQVEHSFYLTAPKPPQDLRRSAKKNGRNV